MSTPRKIARVLLARHGQTDGNKQRYVGWEDPPLNEAGQRQALLIAQRLSSESVTAIFSSPLVRALQTATPLAQRTGLSVFPDRDLREINYGEYQGRSKDELELKLRRHYRHERLPGGESLHDVFQRAYQFAPILLEHLTPGGAVAVVAHYWSSRMLLGVLAGTDFEQLFNSGSYKPGNGSIYEIVLDLEAPRESAILSQVYLTLEAPAACLSPPESLQ